MTTVYEVLAIWQSTTGHELSFESSVEFTGRSDAARLAAVPADILRSTAAAVSGEHPNGHLLLGEWAGIAEDLHIQRTERVRKIWVDAGGSAEEITAEMADRVADFEPDALVRAAELVRLGPNFQALDLIDAVNKGDRYRHRPIPPRAFVPRPPPAPEKCGRCGMPFRADASCRCG